MVILNVFILQQQITATSKTPKEKVFENSKTSKKNL